VWKSYDVRLLTLKVWRGKKTAWRFSNQCKYSEQTVFRYVENHFVITTLLHNITAYETYKLWLVARISVHHSSVDSWPVSKSIIVDFWRRHARRRFLFVFCTSFYSNSLVKRPHTVCPPVASAQRNYTFRRCA